VQDHDALTAHGGSSKRAIATMRSFEGRYDPVLLDALAASDLSAGRMRGIALADLQCGMVLAAAVTNRSGVLLVSEGQEISVSLLTRLRNFAMLEEGVNEPLMVLEVPETPDEDEPSASD
jgi:hypothetical protein